MELYMDEKWKLSKKGSKNSSSRRENPSSSGPAYLKRSSSLPAADQISGRGRIRSSSSSPRSFTSRCASLVKEQRAKFYIMRRCVTMLICWRDYP